MGECSADDSVALDLLGLALRCLDGRLTRGPILAHALRAGLLIDLARSGRITVTAAGTEMDTTPTGWALADELLRDIDTHPTRSMSDLLQRGRPHLSAAVDELCSTERWVLDRRGLTAARRTYREVDPARSLLLATRLAHLAAGRPGQGNEREAATLALAVTGGLSTGHRVWVLPAEVLAECGEVEWLVHEVTRFIVASAAQDRAADFGGNAQFYI